MMQARMCQAWACLLGGDSELMQSTAFAQVGKQPQGLLEPASISRELAQSVLTSAALRGVTCSKPASSALETNRLCTAGAT